MHERANILLHQKWLCWGAGGLKELISFRWDVFFFFWTESELIYGTVRKLFLVRWETRKLKNTSGFRNGCSLRKGWFRGEMETSKLVVSKRRLNKKARMKENFENFYPNSGKGTRNFSPRTGFRSGGLGEVLIRAEPRNIVSILSWSSKVSFSVYQKKKRVFGPSGIFYELGHIYRGCPTNFEPERVARHSAIWRTLKR